jgi:hypothetical protein
MRGNGLAHSIHTLLFMGEAFPMLSGQDNSPSTVSESSAPDGRPGGKALVINIQAERLLCVW